MRIILLVCTNFKEGLEFVEKNRWDRESVLIVCRTEDVVGHKMMDILNIVRTPQYTFNPSIELAISSKIPDLYLGMW